MGTAAVAADTQVQLRGPGQQGWPQLGKNSAGQNLTLVDALAAIKSAVTAIENAVTTTKGSTS